MGVIGFAPGTGLGRDANAFLRFVAKYLLSPLAPHIQYWSTPELTAPVITNVLLNKEQDRLDDRDAAPRRFRVA